MDKYLAHYLRNTLIVVYPALIMSTDCVILLVYNEDLLSPWNQGEPNNFYSYD